MNEGSEHKKEAAQAVVQVDQGGKKRDMRLWLDFNAPKSDKKDRSQSYLPSFSGTSSSSTEEERPSSNLSEVSHSRSPSISSSDGRGG